MKYKGKMGADHNINDEFYRQIISYFKDGDKVLNLGCGSRFHFERVLASHRRVGITSVDIIPVKKIPKYIHRYTQRSIEENFTLKNKFDVACFFEVIEHIDKTDELLRNCYNNLNSEGLLIFSFPNLSSIYSRIELLLGYQPHILEVSNISPLFGSGFFGLKNNGGNLHARTLHHIRGITHRAMKDMLSFHGFSVISNFGYDFRYSAVFKHLPSLAPINFVICKKTTII